MIIHIILLICYLNSTKNDLKAKRASKKHMSSIYKRKLRSYDSLLQENQDFKRKHTEVDIASDNKQNGNTMMGCESLIQSTYTNNDTKSEFRNILLSMYFNTHIENTNKHIDFAFLHVDYLNQIINNFNINSIEVNDELVYNNLWPLDSYKEALKNIWLTRTFKRRLKTYENMIGNAKEIINDNEDLKLKVFASAICHKLSDMENDELRSILFSMLMAFFPNRNLSHRTKHVRMVQLIDFMNFPRYEENCNLAIYDLYRKIFISDGQMYLSKDTLDELNSEHINTQEEVNHEIKEIKTYICENIFDTDKFTTQISKLSSKKKISDRLISCIKEICSDFSLYVFLKYEDDNCIKLKEHLKNFIIKKKIFNEIIPTCLRKIFYNKCGMLTANNRQIRQFKNVLLTSLGLTTLEMRRLAIYGFLFNFYSKLPFEYKEKLENKLLLKTVVTDNIFIFSTWMKLNNLILDIVTKQTY